MHRRLILAVIGLSLPTGAAALSATKSQTPPTSRTAPTSDEPEDPPEPPSFARDVMPTLGRYCESCHGMREQHGGLRLDNYDNLMRGGDSGPVVIARDPQKSLLIAKIEHRDRPSMPPRKWVPKAAIAKIRAWISAGAEP